jgi:hypothetical protein
VGLKTPLVLEGTQHDPYCPAASKCKDNRDIHPLVYLGVIASLPNKRVPRILPFAATARLHFLPQVLTGNTYSDNARFSLLMVKGVLEFSNLGTWIRGMSLYNRGK